MPVSRTRQFAKLPKDIDTDGNIIQTGLAAGVGGAGVEVYDSPGLLTSIGNTNGDQAYVQSNNRLYLWDSTGWYNVALINRTPTFTSITDANSNAGPFALATDGTATVITIVAQDSDGEAITYTVTKGTGFDSIATISQDSSVFTITPFSQDSAGSTTSATLTFNATDGSNIASSAAQTFTLNFLSEYWDEVVLSVGTSDTNSLQNNTYVDRSGNEDGLASRYGTGDTQSAFHPYLDNYSTYFGEDDNSSVVFGNLSASDELGTGAFTIEAWVNPLNISNNGGVINYGTYTGGLMLRVGGSAQLFYNSTSQSLTMPTIGVWSHICLERDGSNNWAWYINGVQKNTWTNSTSITGTGNALQIGRNNHNGSEDFYGWISNVRVVKGSRVYGSAFTPPTEKLTAVSGTTFLGMQDNRWKDNSSSARAVSAINAGCRIEAYNPFGQRSVYSDTSNKGSVRFGTSDAISLETRPSGTTTTYTIEFWYKWDNSTTINGNHYLFDARGTPGGETAGALYLYRTSGTAYNDGTSVGLTDDNLNNGAWHYFAMCNDGTNLTYWLDGSRIKTSTTTKTIGTHLWLNSRQTNQYHNASNYADFRVSSTARYASTDTTITVPTSPLGYDANTTAYYPFDNAGIYDKPGNNTLTLAGNTATSTTQTKFANTSMYFDGSGDYAIADNTVNIFTNNFTIEFWVNLASTSSSNAVSINTGSGVNGIYILHGGFSVYATTNASSWNLFSNTSLASYMSTNTWHHVAVTWDGSTYRIFVDGTLRASASSTASISTTDYNVAIGATKTGAQPSTGYIENVQVLQYAKYTSNFTAPTQEQGFGYQAES